MHMLGYCPVFLKAQTVRLSEQLMPANSYPSVLLFFFLIGCIFFIMAKTSVLPCSRRVVTLGEALPDDDVINVENVTLFQQ